MENRIGEDGFGCKFAMNALEGGRIGITSQAIGIARGGYELAKEYSKIPKAFGKEIMFAPNIKPRGLSLGALCNKSLAAMKLSLKTYFIIPVSCEPSLCSDGDLRSGS